MKNLTKTFAAGFLAMAIVIGQGATVEAATQSEMVDMISEEMTANALYTSLSEKYPEYKVFANLAKSEARHTEALKKSADRLGLDVSAAKAGVLPEFASKEEALVFARDFEQEDIDMLQELIENEDDARLKRVLGNLLKGSENHLKTMTKAVEEGLDSMTCNEDRAYQNRADNQGQKGGRGQGGQGQGQGNGQNAKGNQGQGLGKDNENGRGNGNGQGSGQGRGQGQKLQDGSGQATGRGKGQRNNPKLNCK